MHNDEQKRKYRVLYLIIDKTIPMIDENELVQFILASVPLISILRVNSTFSGVVNPLQCSIPESTNFDKTEIQHHLMS